jgi:hypothetical protein
MEVALNVGLDASFDITYRTGTEYGIKQGS